MGDKIFTFSIISKDDVKKVKSNFIAKYDSNVDRAAQYLISRAITEYKCKDLDNKVDTIIKDAKTIANSVTFDNDSVLNMETPVIISAAGFINLMDSLRKDVQNYYANLYSHGNEAKLREHIKEKADAWKKGKGGLTIYNTSTLTNKLVESESWEYKIFELVRFFKSVDFSEECILIRVRNTNS
jgi:hypothetical protein